MAKRPAKKGDGGKRAAKDRAKKVARASKGMKAVRATKPESGRDEQARRVISANDLKSLAKDVQQAMNRSAEHGGVAGQLISGAVKKKGLNAAAFRIIMRLRRMGENDPVKFGIFRDDFEHYWNSLQLEKLCGGSLFAPREGAVDHDSEESDEPQEPAGDNVVTFQNGGGDDAHAA